MDYLDEMDTFLETLNLPRLSREQIENLGRPVAHQNEHMLTRMWGG